MAHSRKNPLLIESAMGDGNCAFNAFILGLCEQEVLDSIEFNLRQSGQDIDVKLRDFIEAVANQFHVEPHFEVVKQTLLDLKRTNKNKLQKKLAPFMRDYAIWLANRDDGHFVRTEEPLKGAFSSYIRNYIRAQAGLPVLGVQDDIFQQHPLIVNQFNLLLRGINFELVREDNLNEIVEQRQERLFAWWLEGGYAEFLHAMKAEGQWAGDLELFQLARYFHVNLTVNRDAMTHHIHYDYGKFFIGDYDQLSEETIKQLVDRNVINCPPRDIHPDDPIYFLPLTREEIKIRLNQVPHYEQAQTLIENHEHDLKDTPLPLDLPHECVEELVARNVVERNREENDEYEYCFALHAEDAATRIDAVSHVDTLLQAWDENHEDLPTITLSNQAGLHWDNTSTSLDAVMSHEAPTSDLAEVVQYQETEVYKGTLQLVGFWKRTNQDQNKNWNELTRIVEIAPSGLEGNALYTISDTNQAEVTKAKQEELDEALAKKLQQDEYEDYLKSMQPRSRL